MFFHSYIWYINVYTRLFKWHFNPQMITKTAKRIGFLFDKIDQPHLLTCKLDCHRMTG